MDMPSAMGSRTLHWEHFDWAVKLPFEQLGPGAHTVPSCWFPLAMHWDTPVVQEIVPVWQGLAVLQGLPWAQAMQLPPTQTDPVPQVAKASAAAHVPSLPWVLLPKQE